MTHIHRRFSDDQVKHLFRLYVEGQMDRTQVEDPDLPISSFNYSASRESLLELGIRVSLSTIIDASLYRWSPFAEVKWTLVGTASGIKPS